MKLTKIYTKTGDQGETSLVGGIRIAKSAPRIEAYGTIDELSSHIGMLVAMLSESEVHRADYQPITEALERIQNNLFSVASVLATDAKALKANKAEWVAPYIESLSAFNTHLATTETPLLEKWIDRYNEKLPQLQSFILPGGSTEAAQCHVCRTVCRRAERSIDSLRSYGDKTKPEVVTKHMQAHYENEYIEQYMNRLSDYLFVLARKINIINSKKEKTWQNTCR